MRPAFRPLLVVFGVMVVLAGFNAYRRARVAHDGQSALDQAQAFSPEVVLLDIGLPGMDGYEVVRRLRDLPQARGARDDGRFGRAVGVPHLRDPTGKPRGEFGRARLATENQQPDVVEFIDRPQRGQRGHG